MKINNNLYEVSHTRAGFIQSAKELVGFDLIDKWAQCGRVVGWLLLVGGGATM